ncbi:AAA family ATPase [uncultured Bacteroides sp.]|uniref:McrB family protein n=1 Tax=uncultured Bacteroides sp. TaxID=162156 RepID=UPI002620FFD2|nr:AAA family ATPase [uncultured Bacteroides sp.]
MDNTKIQQLIERYKELLQKNGGLQGCNELYKWELISKQKGHPNPEVEDFKSEIYNLKFSVSSGGELCYHTQITAIRNLTQYKSNEYRETIQSLFNESIHLQERIINFIKRNKQLWQEIAHKFSNNTSSMCDERIISCFLTFHNPSLYTFYKDSVYSSLCKYLNITPAKPKYKLVHYYSLLSPIIETVEEDTELLEMVQNELKTHNYIHSLPLIAQDMLWHLSTRFKVIDNAISIDGENEIAINNSSSEMKEITLLKQKKQIILQGAPGTGKTYKTAELAVALCDDVDTTSMDRKDIIERYHELYDEGRIGFVTFHQSTDYEEFVEGIKPSITGNGITYKVLDGIFKKMAIIASATKHNITNEIPKYFGSEDYNSIYTSILNDIKAGKITALESAKYGTFPVYCDGDDIKCNSKAVKRHSHLKTLFNYFINKNRYDIRGLGRDDYFKLIEQLTDGRTRTLDYNYYQGVLRVMLQRAKEATMGIKKQSTETPVEIEDYNDNIIPDQPYLLIIDEINRGNISKIFGELITLLEADKRIGEENELTVTLPYSQETFGVPSNLYIIGTMNTADRSVGYIDYAIRRRFAFITLKADRNVIENYYTDNDLKQKALAYFDQADALMKVSSEYEKDDLMIGHSYFLAKSEEELQNKMVFEVRPLLLEYFNDGLLAFRKDDEEYKAIKNFGEA